MHEQREWADELTAQHEEESVEGHFEPLLHDPAPPIRMTAKAWFAYERGERYCPRDKWQTDDPDVFGCDECGGRLFGRVA